MDAVAAAPRAAQQVVEACHLHVRAQLEAYHGRWGGSVDPAFTEEAY